jgi:glucosamine 6-phosphate synthetase-like amidotransferase/phosphosugar isomerase protein
VKEREHKMCGLAGGIAPRLSSSERHDILRKQLIYTVERGRDASGVGFHIDGDPHVVKLPLEGPKFVKEEVFEELEEILPVTWIAHNRGASIRGSEKLNHKNHPVLSKQTGVMLVHNGNIRNDSVWRMENGDNPYVLHKFDGEVDTEAALRLIETARYIPREHDLTIDPERVKNIPKEEWTPSVDWMKAIDDATYCLTGDFVLNVLVPDEPNTVYLVRHNNPLYLAYVPEWEALLWTSTHEIMKKVLTSYESEQVFNFLYRTKEKTVDYYGRDVPQDTLTKISWDEQNGFQVDHRSIKPASFSKANVTVTKESVRVS